LLFFPEWEKRPPHEITGRCHFYNLSHFLVR
jgi:hypothetical protein